MPGKTTLRMRISDMLRFMYENIASIGAGTEGLQLLKEYNHWEERENLLKEYLKSQDGYAYLELIKIDAAQDKIIKNILNLFVLIIAENQASNKLIEHYDPKAMQEKVKEEMKRIKSQFLLFEGGESVGKRKQNSMEKGHEIPCKRSNEGNKNSQEKVPRILNLVWKEESGRGTAIPHRSV